MKNILKRAYLFLILVFLYAPIIVLIIFSFNESKSRVKWTGFSLKWYVELFKDPNIMKALYYTILIAVLSSLIAVIIGTFAAFGINNMPKFQRKIILNITNIPVLNPDIVTGVSLMILFIFIFNTFNFGSLGFTTLLLAHITFNIPYVILSVLPKLRQLDKNLFEAGLDLGASPMQTFFKVILPEIMPGVITGAMLSFTMSLDDFVISFFTTGSGVSNLSIAIYSMTKQSINPKVNALSTLMFVVVLILLYLIKKRDNSKNNSRT